ncbi:MAG: hypothetical protein ABDK94_07455 [Atribacterota bacterium]
MKDNLRYAIFIGIFVILGIVLSPFVWNVMTSFKDKGEYFTYPPSLSLSSLTLNTIFKG